MLSGSFGTREVLPRDSDSWRPEKTRRALCELALANANLDELYDTWQDEGAASRRKRSILPTTFFRKWWLARSLAHPASEHRVQGSAAGGASGFVSV